MVDVLIHDIPDDVIDRIDSAAQVAGQTRTEYLRHQIGGIAAGGDAPVTLAGIDRFASHFTDRRDEDVLRDAWR